MISPAQKQNGRADHRAPCAQRTMSRIGTRRTADLFTVKLRGDLH